MPTDAPHNEAESVSGAICASIEAILATFEGLSVEELNWRPAVAEPNTLTIIATHVMGNARKNVVEHFGGMPIDRVREEEFAVEGDLALSLRERWGELREEIVETISGAQEESWTVMVDHATEGRITAREALLSAHRHASEHLGEAQMIRDLILSAR